MSTPPDPLLPARPTRRRREQDRARRTIDVVIDATISLIEQAGVGSVRVADVTAATGVSHGAIYHHFGNRDGLVRAAQFARLTRQPGQDVAALGAAVAGSRDRADFVAVVALIAAAIAAPERVSVRLVRASVIASAQHRPDLAAALDDLERGVADQLVAVLVDAQARGFVDAELDPRAVAAVLEAVSFGLVLQEHAGQDVERAALATAIERAFLAFLPSPPD